MTTMATAARLAATLTVAAILAISAKPAAAESPIIFGTCTSTLLMEQGGVPTGNITCPVSTTEGSANFRVDNVPLYLTATPATGTATTTTLNIVLTVNDIGRASLVPQVTVNNIAIFDTSANEAVGSQFVFFEVRHDGPPPNDNFANALNYPVTQSTAVTVNSTATTEAGEGNFRSVWYAFTSPTSTTYVIDTVGSFSTVNGNDIDTILTVYTGTSLTGLAPVVTNDDFAARFVSQVVLDAAAGTTYRIRVATKATSAAAGFGMYRLNIQPMPSNRIVVSPQRPYAADGTLGSFTNGGGRSYYVSNYSNNPVTIAPTTSAPGYSFSIPSVDLLPNEGARIRLNEAIDASATAGSFTDAVTWGAAGTTEVRRSISTAVPETTLFASVLPVFRSRAFGDPATAFATVLNAGAVTAQGCYIAGGTGTLGLIDFQRTDAANLPMGPPNQFVSIPAGAFQTFVFALNPSYIGSRNLLMTFDCANSLRAAPINGVNTFVLSTTTTQGADMVTIGATPTNDGILNVPVDGATAMAVASVNIGTANTVRAFVIDNFDRNPFSLPLTVTVCRSNPSTGACQAPPTANVDLGAIANNEVVTLSLFVQGQGTPVPLDPAVKRLFITFEDGVGNPLGGTSVAVRTTPTDAAARTASR